MAGRGKADKSGRSSKMGAFTPMLHEVLDSPAFQSLTTLAESLYWQLSRRAGYKGQHNGEVFYSIREAAERYRVSKDTASTAFDLLQARGFIVPTQIGHLGIEGAGRATTWRLTEWPAQNGHAATKDFLRWAPGHDFPVKKGRPPRHTKQNPVLPRRTPCPSLSDDGPQEPTETGPACPSPSDDGAVLEPLPVLPRRTPKDLPGGGKGQRAAVPSSPQQPEQ